MPHNEQDTNCYLPTPDEIARVAKELRRRHLAAMLTREPYKRKERREPPSHNQRRGTERGDG